METIAKRIKKGLELRGMKQVDLVNKTGIGKSSISTYLNGEYEPKQKNIYKIALALNVNEAWLMGYDVPMERIELGYNVEIKEDAYKKDTRLNLDEDTIKAIEKKPKLKELFSKLAMLDDEHLDAFATLVGLKDNQED